MDRITYTSVLSAEHRDDLERLLFFNSDQPRLRETIVAAIEKHGIPRITVENKRLRVRLEGGDEVQSLFAMVEGAWRPSLVGVVIYTRSARETILVLHLAARDDYNFQGCRADSLLTMRLLAKLREIAGHIKGVRVVRVFYGQGTVRDIPV